MSRRNRWETPLPGGTLPTEQPEIIELSPNPLPADQPISRESTLARVHAGFAALDDNELRVARLWLQGTAIHDVCNRLGLSESAVRKIWREMRRKLRAAIVANE